ncbi:MBL fold metallo-hydrolase RNA specificity domain-containing protein [Flavitalea sp.]|nr:MBL fold metallo-hydrolase [Flavitalea sp.]
MKLSFHGAAQTVTGSKHLLALKNGKKYLLDCGLFQGMGRDTDSMNREWGFDPATVTHLILSHAHIDHSGLIPKLVKDGFNGKIFSTHGTRDLAGILLEDSARIQESDIKYSNKSRKLKGLPLLEPLYSTENTRQAIELFESVDYGAWHRIDENVSVLFTDAGHIIGSAAVHVQVNEDGRQTNITFSGDVGRYRDIILRSPQAFPQADYILLESTYGDSLHDMFAATPDVLLNWIQKTCVQQKGKLIMPAFSVGRTQELLFALNQLELEGTLPSLNYYVDSPLSLEATAVVKKYPGYFNSTIQKLLLTDSDPFGFSGLRFVTDVEESKMLNYLNEPCVIISSSGMAEAGRVKHHISNNIENSHNTILFTGYCEPRSLGGKLLAGAKEVGIFGVTHEVHAEIGSIRSMSAHGDYEDLLEFISGQDPSKVKTLFLVHGEPDVQQQFRKRILNKGFKDVQIPARHSEVILS